jgi:hypothetical protein
MTFRKAPTVLVPLVQEKRPRAGPREQHRSRGKFRDDRRRRTIRSAARGHEPRQLAPG